MVDSDQTTLTAVAPLPITALARICLDPRLDDKARALMATALALPARYEQHRLVWSNEGVSLTVDTVRLPDDAYQATLTIGSGITASAPAPVALPAPPRRTVVRRNQPIKEAP